MKIQLLNKSNYLELKNIFEKNKGLTFQNNGYEYINIQNLSNEDKESFYRVNQILKNHIVGFYRFNNFRLTKNKNIQIRFQYNYGEEDNTMYFVGVGYILLDELLNGFNSNCEAI